MTPSWDDHYPEKAVLRREVRCMADSFAEVLLEAIAEPEIAGIYLKGSAQKDWDSPIDYVPELSDVDIHLLFADDALVEKHLGTSEQAMRIQAEVEKRYFRKLVDPVHVARPQLIVLNQLVKQEDYLGSPRSTVKVLYGPEPPEPDYSDIARVRDIAYRQLIELEDYLRIFPLHVVDKPGRYLWQSLRQMVWRVSPVGPKVLVLLGLAAERAWGMNRTAAVSELKTLGEERLAEDYADFYVSGWKYFLSDYADHDAARSALASAVRAMERGVEIARSSRTHNPGRLTDSP